MVLEILSKTSVRSLALAFALSAGLLAQSNSAQRKPDNTATNKRDQAEGAATADKAKNNKSDLEIAREIRRSVVRDKSLSVYGHNVKIIAQGGKVTLKGPVHTDEEKNTIASYAQKVAGDGNVVNEISVKGDSK